MVLVLQDGESGCPPPGELGLSVFRLLLLLLLSERGVCAQAPAAPADGGAPPLSSVAVTAVGPSDRFGGLLDEQSGTVNLGSHHSGEIS
ncbi:uncharacterized protein V6R79_011241 [Siganus canaliculatus]